MASRIVSGVLILVIGLVCEGTGAEPKTSLAPPEETALAAGKDQPDKKKKPDDKTPEPKIEIPVVPPRSRFDRESVRGFTPHMMGDYPGIIALRRITLIGTQTTTVSVFDIEFKRTTTTSTTKTSTQTVLALIPSAASGAFKVAENESPMPIDRVFSTYNFFGNVRGSVLGPLVTSNQQITNPPSVIVTTTTTNVIPLPQANIHREIFGFEKTFLDGYASVEVRLPYLQQTGNQDALVGAFFGDLTIVTKYAFLLNRTTGEVLSGGLVITAPTGQGIESLQGTIRTTLLQPWFGYIKSFDRFFVQGFHSVVIPTDSRDVTLLFNDVGLGCRLFQRGPDRMISAIVPTLEVHATTPLNHRGEGNAVIAPDLVALTGGVHLGIFRNATLSLGVVTPITGPRVFNIEAMAQFNWRF